MAGAAPPSIAAEIHVGRPVMGTVLQLTVVADDPHGARRAAEAAIARATHWDDVLTTWRPEGELARLDEAAGRGPRPISADLASALERMAGLREATRGAFDPAVGPLVTWWRRGGPASGEHRPDGPLRWPEAIRLDGRRATLAAGAMIDAGGIGKGIAVDAMLEVFRVARVDAVFMDFGRSTLAARGAPPEDPHGFAVVVAGLRASSAHGVLHLEDEALSTSRAGGVGDDAGAIVDPRTGDVVRGERLAVVLARDATTAEAWSTALVVLGREGRLAVAAAGLDALIEDEQGVVVTPGFARRLRESRRSIEPRRGSGTDRRIPRSFQSRICCAR